SNIPTTMGDEAGSVGGITSGTIKGIGFFLSGSPIVYIEKLPAVRLTSRASGNMENARGAVLIPGQPIVYVAFDGELGALRDGSPPAGVARRGADVRKGHGAVRWWSARYGCDVCPGRAAWGSLSRGQRHLPGGARTVLTVAPTCVLVRDHGQRRSNG